MSAAAPAVLPEAAGPEPVIGTPPAPAGFTPPDPKNYAENSEVADRAKKHVLAALSAADSLRGQKPSEWQENYYAWRGIRQRKSYHGRANVVDPEPGRAIETIVARLEEAVLSRIPFVRGLPGPGETSMDREQAEILENLIHYQLDRGSDGSSVIQSLIKDLCIYGTAIIRVFWDTKHSVVRKRRNGKLDFAFEETWRGPRIRLVPIEDFYFSRLVRTETANEQDFVIERCEVAHRDLLALEEKGTLTNVKELKHMPSAEESRRAIRHNAIGVSYEAADENQHLKTIEMHYYEGAFKLREDDEVETDCWIWMANKSKIVRVIQNPCYHRRKSYVSIHCIRAPGEVYGVSVIDWIKDLWAALCDKQNQGLDSATLALNPMWKVGSGAGFEQSRVLVRPGGTIRCIGDPDMLQPVALPDVSPVAYNAMAVIRAQIRETTGATDMLIGGTSGGVDKATIYQGMLNEANMRLRHILRNIDVMGLAPIADLCWALDQQHITRKEVVRILGRDGFKYAPVRPEDLDYSMDWKGTGTVNLSSILSRNMGFERVLATATPLVLKGALKMNLEEPFKEWLHSMGLTGVERMFGTGEVEPLDANHENVMLEQGQHIDVHVKDDDHAHARKHLPLREHSEPSVQLAVEEHIQDHLLQIERKKNYMQQQAQIQTAMLKQQLEAGANGGQGGQAGGGAQGAPAIANQQTFGPETGGVKEAAEMTAGRPG